MTVFLDISAKRIQAYLARTPRLKGRRGASALLNHDDLRQATEPAWQGHAELNDEGKKTDGALSLRFIRDVPEAELDQVITRSIAFLQRLAPGAEWELRVRRAESYRRALEESVVAERTGQALLPGQEQRLILVPAVAAEVPVVRFCDSCGCDPAVQTRSVEWDPDPVSLCADCTRRLFEGGARSDRRNWTEDQWAQHIAGGLGAEKSLVEAVTKSLGRPVSVAVEFADLAALGGGDANHLCTVFVDGNRFGDLFAGLKDTSISLNTLSTRLAEAMTEALAVATREVMRDSDQYLPVVPHLIGGDDLLATVTADRAWDFVLTLLANYQTRTVALVAEYGAEAGTSLPLPTASAGLVFAHTAFPFAGALDLADDALRKAKTDHRGRESAVCWVDVTEDGPALPPDRAAPTLAALDTGRGLLDGLVRIPPSGRAALAAVADQADQVADLAMRLDRAELLLPFDLPGAPLPLRDALVLGRWWQCRKTV